MFKSLQPAGWKRPRGYSNGIAARGTTIFVAGQIGWNGNEEFESDDFVAQARQAMLNIKAVLDEAGASPAHMTRMTWYMVDKKEYLSAGKEVGAAYRDVLGLNFPVMTAVEVTSLMEDKARIEIEVTAVIPD